MIYNAGHLQLYNERNLMLCCVLAITHLANYKRICLDLKKARRIRLDPIPSVQWRAKRPQEQSCAR